MIQEVDTPELRDVAEGAPLQRVVPATRNDLLAVATAGYRFIDQGQWEKARNAFHALTQLSPKLSVGYAGLGAVSLKERKLPEAIDSLTKALEINPKDSMILTNMGEAKLRLGLPDEAATFFGWAIQLDPAGTHPMANRARAMLAGIEERKTNQAATSE